MRLKVLYSYYPVLVLIPIFFLFEHLDFKHYHQVIAISLAFIWSSLKIQLLIFRK